MLKGVPGTGVNAPLAATLRASISPTAKCAVYTNRPERDTARPPVQFEVENGEPGTGNRDPSVATWKDEMSLEKVSLVNSWLLRSTFTATLADDVPFEKGDPGMGVRLPLLASEKTSMRLKFEPALTEKTSVFAQLTSTSMAFPPGGEGRAGNGGECAGCADAVDADRLQGGFSDYQELPVGSDFEAL